MSCFFFFVVIVVAVVVFLLLSFLLLSCEMSLRRDAKHLFCMMGQGSRLIVALAAGATIHKLRCFCGCCRWCCFLVVVVVFVVVV